MEWVKTTAKTLPEAIDLALDNLGVDESEAEIEVVEEPKATLFGLRTKGVARVRARVKPKSIRPKQSRDRRNNRRKGGDNGRGDRNRSRNRGDDRNQNKRSRDDAKGSDAKGSGAKGAKSGSGGDQNNDRKQESGRTDGTAKQGGSKGRGSKRDGRRDGGQGGRGSKGDDNGSNQGRAKAAAAAAGSGGGGRGRNSGGDKNATSEKASSKKAPEKETPVQEVADHLEEFMQGLTDAFGLDGDVTIDDSEPDTLIASVDQQHGLMVGPKGRTLDAIQELARISAQRSTPSSIRIRVDVGGYRAKRNAALTDFAQKAADKAVDNGVEVALEPMNPADRKIVHDALNGDARVETRSVGQEPRRKVLVVPVAGTGGHTDDEE